MPKLKTMSDGLGKERSARSKRAQRQQGKRRRFLVLALVCVCAVAMVLVVALWLGGRASVIKSNLQAATKLMPQLKDDLLNQRMTEASTAVAQLKTHTSTARDAADDPLWKMASGIPWIGANFSAASEVTRSADDVATLGVAPLVQVFESLDYDQLLPGPDGANLEPIRSSAPVVASASNAVKLSSERLKAIDLTELLPQIANPLREARGQLESVEGVLEVAANTSKLAPAMLGSEEPRRYLLLIQNNAELRASGGIPGALAVLTAEKGKLTLGEQTTAGELGAFIPPIDVDEEQKATYSARLGKFAQDVNLTPDFPSTAATIRRMWEQRKGEALDGVLSIDPVALSFILEATGPIELEDLPRAAVAAGMPAKLTGENVVKTLLSDVYAKIARPVDQDAYFAAVAGKIFTELSTGKSEAARLMEGLGRGVSERRVMIWSANEAEQSVLAGYTISGAISGPNTSAAEFGVYFNDGTGAKMDYYVKRNVQLFTKCPANGYSQVTVRVTSTNTAPKDAATSLPKYVTGGGAFGIEPGSVQTNIVAYGPTQAHIEQTTQDGNRVPFQSQVHAERPVGVVTTLLKPGQSTTVDFSFDKIVQHTEPELVVTPTTDAVKNVVMNSTSEACDSGK